MPASARNQGSDRQGRNMVRFGIILVLCFVAFSIVYFCLRRSAIVTPFLGFNATVSSFILNLFGGSSEVDGTIIASGSNSFQVITECTSAIPTAILVSAILAWQCGPRDKLTGICLGVPLLFAINIGRIISLLYVGSAFPDFFEIAHFYIWQGLLILITVVLWLIWAEKLVRTPTETP